MYNDIITEILKTTEPLSELVVLSGRSGSGKTAIIDTIIENYNGIEFPGAYPSKWNPTPQLNIRKAKNRYTTREERPDDERGEFTYIDKKEFQELLRTGEIKVSYFSEGAGQYYGWSEKELRPRKNEIVLTTANDEAVAKDLKYLRDSTNIFINVDKKTLAKRITARGGDKNLIQSRIKKLNKNHPTTGYDENGIPYNISMEDDFYGTYDKLEGTAHLIIENNGDLNFTAEKALQEILRLADEKQIHTHLPAQKKLSFHRQGNNNICNETILRPRYRLTATGRIPEYKHINTDRDPDYKTLVVLGVSRLYFESKRIAPEYFIRISDFEDSDLESEMGTERKHMFRGMITKPVEFWASEKDIIDLDSLESDMSPIYRHSPGEDVYGEVLIKGAYFKGDTPYRTIRDTFEKNELTRII